jgi:hypothetical protein
MGVDRESQIWQRAMLVAALKLRHICGMLLMLR